MAALKIFTTFFIMVIYFSTGNAKKATFPSIERYELKAPPVIGVTATGQFIELGGFSGLRFLGKTPKGKLQFLTHTDRGPNPDAYREQGKIKRPFLLPNFNLRLIILLADPATRTMKVSRQIFLKDFDNKLLTGLPHSLFYDEQPVDVFGKDLAFNRAGRDLEGIDVASDLSYWMVDEYDPSLIHFSAQGQLLDLFYPGQGLPEVLRQRQLNLGFEGIALQGEKVYAILQSPLDNPKSKDGANGKKSKNIRIIEFNIQKKLTSGQFLYLLEEESNRIGDMVSLGKGLFLVIEQNNKTEKNAYKKIFLVDLTKATNLQLLDKKIVGVSGTLESLTPDSLKMAGIQSVRKQEILNLVLLGIKDKKVEGLSLVEPNKIALIIDNDFSLSGRLDRKKGIASFKKKKSYLYLITF